MGRRIQMESIFLPMVQPAKMKEFQAKWRDWICLSNEVEEEKTTGKLKVEFMTFNGRMISLSPKSYFCYCWDTHETKDGRKGVPSWWDLRFADFENTLYRKEKPAPIEIRSLRLRDNRRMKRTTTRRSGLTSIHVKMSVQSDLITCTPIEKNGIFE